MRDPRVSAAQAAPFINVSSAEVTPGDTDSYRWLQLRTPSTHPVPWKSTLHRTWRWH